MIDQFLKSDKAVHSILDHHCHGNLMGCNFGIHNVRVRERYPEKILDMSKYIPELASSNSHLNKPNESSFLPFHSATIRFPVSKILLLKIFLPPLTSPFCMPFLSVNTFKIKEVSE